MRRSAEGRFSPAGLQAPGRQQTENVSLVFCDLSVRGRFEATRETDYPRTSNLGTKAAGRGFPCMQIGDFNTHEHAHGGLYMAAKVALLQFRTEHQMHVTDAAADEVQRALLEVVEATRRSAGDAPRSSP